MRLPSASPRLLILFCTLLFGCSAFESEPAPAPSPASKAGMAGELAGKIPLDLMQTPDTLGPGDIFEVSVYGEKDLSGRYRVSSDGSIDFPLIGRLVVASLTGAQVAVRLRDGLTDYLRRPQVSVFIQEFRSKKVYVYGKVRKPGTFTYEDGMSIIQAITMAGGFGDLADDKKVYVNRVTNGAEERFQVSVRDIGKGQAPNLVLRPGDIVYVPESLF